MVTGGGELEQPAFVPRTNGKRHDWDPNVSDPEVRSLSGGGHSSHQSLLTQAVPRRVALCAYRASIRSNPLTAANQMVSEASSNTMSV